MPTYQVMRGTETERDSERTGIQVTLALPLCLVSYLLWSQSCTSLETCLVLLVGLKEEQETDELWLLHLLLTELCPPKLYVYVLNTSTPECDIT